MLTPLVLCSRVHIDLAVHHSLCPYHFLRVEAIQKSGIEKGGTVYFIIFITKYGLLWDAYSFTFIPVLLLSFLGWALQRGREEGYGQT